MYTGFIGCWKTETAKVVAETLREDGFSVIMRGRGTRKRYLSRRRYNKYVKDIKAGNNYYWRISDFGDWKREHRDSFPLKYADYASVYVRNSHTYDEKVNIMPFTVHICRRCGRKFRCTNFCASMYENYICACDKCDRSMLSCETQFEPIPKVIPGRIASLIDTL